MTSWQAKLKFPKHTHTVTINKSGRWNPGGLSALWWGERLRGPGTETPTSLTQTNIPSLGLRGAWRGGKHAWSVVVVLSIDRLEVRGRGAYEEARE